MLLDNQNLFCENQQITNGTIYSENIIAFGKNDVSFVPLLIQAVSDFSSLVSLTVKVQTSSNSDFSNASDLAISTLGLADLKCGSTFSITFLPKGNKGFMRLAFVVDGSETTGKITSAVVAGSGLSYQDI